MEIYLMRHGDAEENRPGQPDAERRLTAEGEEETRLTVKRAAKAGLAPGTIVSSPYVRARQTAAIAGAVLDYEGEIAYSKSLVPHGSPEFAWTDFRAFGAKEQILLVGHEPLLSGFIAYLLNSPQLSVSVKTASICRIDLPANGAPRGVLRWLITPKVCQ